MIGAVVMVAKIATGEIEDTKGKSPGRAKGGKIGGKRLPRKNDLQGAEPSVAPPRVRIRTPAAQLGTAAFGFGGKAASVIVPRRRSSAILSALSSFSSGGT